jgi:3-hydroxyisobutyrate dehydrogenase
MPETRIGFIGTGIMGLPMARNLLKAGYSVTACNRTRERATPLLHEGATLADSPRLAAAESDLVITMVPDTPDVVEVITGEEGVIRGGRAGQVVVDMSTISPGVTRRLAAQLEERGIEMLDAPVSGGEKGAIEGTLSIMVGGRRQVLERCRPLFEAMGKKIVYCGDHGHGQMVKMCNQAAISCNLLAASEAVALAGKAGVDPMTMLEAVGAGAAGSWVIENLGPLMVRADFAPGFMVKLQQKDLRLVMETASELGIVLPGVSLVHRLYSEVEAMGAGDLGTQSLVSVIERLRPKGPNENHDREEVE